MTIRSSILLLVVMPIVLIGSFLWLGTIGDDDSSGGDTRAFQATATLYLTPYPTDPTATRSLTAPEEKPIFYFPTQPPNLPVPDTEVTGELVLVTRIRFSHPLPVATYVPATVEPLPAPLCLWVINAGESYGVVWPHGWGWREDGETIEVMNEAGEVLARSGDIVTLGGGPGGFDDPDERHPCVNQWSSWRAGLCLEVVD